MRSTGGAVELAEHVPDRDAPAVARLKDAGAIVFGKTNLPQWSRDMHTFNSLFGTTNNPWSLERTPGGSSGGAAAAVSCGFTSFELGTDIAGSIRIPSHFCGVFGLKPTYGLVPQRGNLDHVGGGTTDSDINVFGPIARAPEDLDLLLGVLAGPAPEQALAWRVELPVAQGSSLADYRIAVSIDDPDCPVETGYRGALQSLVDRLADAGARIEAAHPPVSFHDQVQLFLALFGAAMSASSPKDDVSAGGSHRGWLRRQEQRARFGTTWSDWFGRYDLLLFPVTPTAALVHNDEPFTRRHMSVDGVDRPYLENLSWTGLIELLGLPAAVAPIGRIGDGLPVGVQVVAPLLRDRDAIRGATLIADLVGGYVPPPSAL
jgi:amidase